MSTRPPYQRELDTDHGYREVRDPCYGRSAAADPGKLGSPSHHWRADDACGEIIEWDLLWVDPYDVGVVEMKAIALQAASEP